MVELDGHTLTPEAAARVMLAGEGVRASPDALSRVSESHRRLLVRISQGGPIYGVSTGFGKLSRVSIPPEDFGALQENVVRSHAAGVGAPLSDEAVRGMLLFRANSLLKGLSGVRPEVIELLLGMLNAGVYPVVPEQGSVGASGDLVPLAHLSLVLLGEGRARFRGEELPGEEALRRAGLSPLSGLAPKEGLALLNGTSYMLSLTTLAWALGRRAFQAALLSSSLTFQALRGSTAPLDERLHEARPHPGQIKVARKLRELLSGSSLTDSWKGDVQDPYSLRCLPQLLGPVLEALLWVEERLRIEMNSATDNPLIFPDGEVLPGGNFHGEILAFSAEALAVALAELGAGCERRMSLLLSAEERGLPPFLSPEAGPSSGLMLLQYTAASLTAENKVLSHPAAVDSIPTSAGKEDHNSMGATSAWKALRIAENVISQVALELTCARWAVALAGEEGLSPATKAPYERLSQLVPPPGPDRYLGEAIAKVREAVRSGEVSVGGL
ncbi:MAG: Histidine ammonia-lyase [Acetothermia bacterium 64_32]|nr:MAG: Histidine ammonia-lyase [Acetothermia bacterium 64_32]HAF70719.1 histidine ammonia-lyase [Candidatus Acetothermia bacterium]